MRKEVPTETLRRAIEDSGMTYTEVARRMGWMKPDINRLKRVVGEAPAVNGAGRPSFSRSTSYERAELIIKAIGADPVDYDL